MNFEKPIKDFVAQFQKDLTQFQQTMQKEGDVLIKKFRSLATKEKILAKGKEIEKLVETKLEKFEPALQDFLAKVSQKAQKAGFDVTDLEKIVMTNYKKARSGLHTAAKKVRSRTAKASGAVKKTVKSKRTKKASTSAQS